MSKEDKYFTVPLAVLRSGQSGLEALEACIDCGIVNAGHGYREAHGSDRFEELLADAKEAATKKDEPVAPPKKWILSDSNGIAIPCWRANELWFAALAGCKLLNVSGGSRLHDVEVWAKHHRPGEVFFRMKGDWLWDAVRTARKDAGRQIDHVPKPISWREFRILAGILSSKVNSYDFTFCGWEIIQARACGFHTKERFNQGKATLPPHCQPLTRQMIRDGTEKLEALGFFARCRYSRGPSGGLSAYSFRHPNREDLLAAVNRWDMANQSFKSKIAAFRASDVEAFKRTKNPPSENQHK